MKQIRYCLPADLISVEKGYSGPRPGHKYKFRSRKMIGGKMTWVYVYDDEKTKRAAKESEAEELRGLPKGRMMTLSAYYNLYPYERQFHASKPTSPVSFEQALKRAGIKTEAEGGVEIVAGKGYTRAPINDFLKDPMGAQDLTPERWLDLALSRLPPSIAGRFGDFVDKIQIDAKAEGVLGEISGGGGTALAAFDSESRRILVSKKAFRNVGSGESFNGGLQPVTTLLHEIGHAVELGPGNSRLATLWRGALKKSSKLDEYPISAYSTSSQEERFAETFAAILTFPYEVAKKSPTLYEFFRENVFDPGELRPLRTDVERKRAAENALARLGREGDKRKAAKLQYDAEMSVGILDVGKEDERLKWWKPQRVTRVQRLLSDAAKLTDYSDSFRLDPTNGDKLAKPGTMEDRFFVMHHKGRAVYFRYGASSKDKTPRRVSPDKAGGDSWSANEIKEVYTENGDPLPRQLIEWWLHQDEDSLLDSSDAARSIPSLTAFLQKDPNVVQTGEEKPKGDAEKEWNKRRIASVWPKREKKGLKGKLNDDEAPTVPAEITMNDFYMNSGGYAFARVEEEGKAELDAYLNATSDSEAKKALTRYVETTGGRAKTRQVRGAKGRFTKEKEYILGPSYGTSRRKPPIMLSRSYVTLNKDGTKTRFLIDEANGTYDFHDPVMHELLNPMVAGEHKKIRSAADLKKVLRAASLVKNEDGTLGRRAWVNIRATTGKKPLNFHIQLRFDGKGSPLIEGDYWKRTLGTDTPRLSDLYNFYEIDSKGRAKINVPDVKATKGRRVLPTIGGIAEYYDPVRQRWGVVLVDGVFTNAKGKEMAILKPVQGGGLLSTKPITVPLSEIGEIDEGGTDVGMTIIPNTEVFRGMKISGRVKPLEKQVLVYMHQQTDRQGNVVGVSLRLLPPKDSSVITPVQISRIPGVRFDRESGLLTVEIAQIPKLREELGGFVLTDEAADMLADYQEHLEEAVKQQEEANFTPIEAISPEKINGLVDRIKGKPFRLGAHQKSFIRKAIHNGGRMLAAHYMGTGKTITAIATFRAMQDPRTNPDPEDPTIANRKTAPKKLLCVVPKNTLSNWQDEVAMVTGENPLVVGSEPGMLSGADFAKIAANGSPDIVVVSPDMLLAHRKEFEAAGFDAIVYDEAHTRIRRPGAGSARQTLNVLRTLNKESKMMVLLTGTPQKDDAADFLEYIRLLSKNKVWADMTASGFVNDYLEAHPGFKELTGSRRSPRKARTKIKDERLADVVRVLNQYVDVVETQDVKGKEMPVAVMDPHEAIPMKGVQEALYARDLAAISPEDAEKLRELAAAGESEDSDQANLSEDLRASVAKARMHENCPAIRPSDKNPNIRVTYRTIDTRGNPVSSRVDFETLNPKKVKEWPQIAALSGGAEAALIYAQMFGPTFGFENYEDIAGKPITAAQRKQMTKMGWPTKVPNPEYGSLGIVFRGEIDENGETVSTLTRKNAYGRTVTIKKGDSWVSDYLEGSQHFLYREKDWNDKDSVPKPGAKHLGERGMRAEREKADLAMVSGNAKTDQMEIDLRELNKDGGHRQSVYFASSTLQGVLGGVRVMEAKLRTMGYVDINEAIKGTPYFDPGAPGATSEGVVAPSGRYYATYVSTSNTIGDRDLNSDIFRKAKDVNQRDLHTSLLVSKLMTGSGTVPARTNDGVVRVDMSDSSKRSLKAAFGIKAPDYVYHSPTAGGGEELLYFYGSPKSRSLESKIADLSAKLQAARTKKAKAEIDAKIATARAALWAEVKKKANAKPPLTPHQRTVFNNCEVMIGSDAANVGLNWGNGTQLTHYDSLPNPMDEAQRMTRTARALPAAVEASIRPVVEKIKASEKAMFHPRNKTTQIPQVDIGGGLPPGRISDLWPDVYHDFVMASHGHPDIEDMSVDIREFGDLCRKARWTEAVDKAKEMRSRYAAGSGAKGTGGHSLIYNVRPTGNFSRVKAGQEPPPPDSTIEERMTSIVNSLPAEDKHALGEAGFTESAMVDLYLNIRVDDILSKLHKEFESARNRLKAGTAASVITDADVMATLVPPPGVENSAGYAITAQEREILQRAGYLKNIKRFTVSAVTMGEVLVPAEPGTPKSEATVLIGDTLYVRTAQKINRNPVLTEVQRDAISRAKQVPWEELIDAIKVGDVQRTEMHTVSASSTEIGGWAMMKSLGTEVEILHYVPESFLLQKNFAKIGRP